MDFLVGPSGLSDFYRKESILRRKVIRRWDQESSNRQWEGHPMKRCREVLRLLVR